MARLEMDVHILSTHWYVLILLYCVLFFYFSNMDLDTIITAWVVGGGRAFLAVSCMLFQFFRSIDKQPEDVITRDDMCVVDYYI